jgi:murein L,D-transpeptidase YcbB/YkuD
MRRGRIPLLMLLAFGVATGWSPASAAPARHGKAAARSVKGTAPRFPKAVKPAAPQADVKPIADQLHGQAKGAVGRFYAGRGYWPLWATSGRIGPEAEALLDLLATSQLDGLDPNAFDVAGLRTAVSQAKDGDPAAVAHAELILSQALARYVAEVRRPSRVKMVWLDRTLKPKKLKPEAVLSTAALQTSLKDYITAMGWMSPHYLRMRALLAEAEKDGMDEDGLGHLRLNLDRVRLLPGPWTRHIVVDTASARL